MNCRNITKLDSNKMVDDDDDDDGKFCIHHKDALYAQQDNQQQQRVGEVVRIEEKWGKVVDNIIH